jgi:hypothetical protein
MNKPKILAKTSQIPKLPPIKLTDDAKVITLVCYLLEYLGSLTEAQLLEIVTIDGIVAQFKLTDALTVMENKGLTAFDGKAYTIIEAGKAWLSEFENTLAITLRRRMLQEGKDVVRLSSLSKAVKWSITHTDNGWIFRALFLNEMDGKPVMEIKLYSKTKEGAVLAQEKFLQNPAKALSDSIANFI